MSLVRSYNKTVMRSNMAIASSSVSLGASLRVQNVAVTSPDAFQVCHASFFPLVANDETLSHPV